MNASATLNLIGFLLVSALMLMSVTLVRYIYRYLVKFARFGDKFDDVIDFFGRHDGLYRRIQFLYVYKVE